MDTPQPPHRAADAFRRLAAWASHHFGSHWAFTVAVGVVLVWAISGPIFDFSEHWQLFIHTFTSIITFVMTFLIQSTQNRDARATQLKLDEVIRVSAARNLFARIEDASQAEIEHLEKEFHHLREGSVSDAKT